MMGFLLTYMVVVLCGVCCLWKIVTWDGLGWVSCSLCSVISHMLETYLEIELWVSLGQDFFYLWYRNLVLAAWGDGWYSELLIAGYSSPALDFSRSMSDPEHVESSYLEQTKRSNRKDWTKNSSIRIAISATSKSPVRPQVTLIYNPSPLLSSSNHCQCVPWPI
jgi:hypothetical protein